MRVLLLTVLLVLVGCSAEAEVQDQVRSLLKDPESARFESVSVREIDGTRVACGLVNAKNALGGYAGSQSFMLKGDKLWLAQNSKQSFAVTSCCGMEITTSRTPEREAEILAVCTPDLPEPVTLY
jgi:hypothetical protein